MKGSKIEEKKIPLLEVKQQAEHDQSILLSLSKEIISCRNREDVQHIVSDKLGKYFQFNDVMICMNNSDNLTHNGYVHAVSDETKNHPDFARGAVMKYFINDGIFDVIENAEGPVIFDMDELVTRSNKPFYVDFWHQLHVKEIIGFPLRVNNVSVGGVTLYPKIKTAFTQSQLGLVQAICSYIGIALSHILAYEKIQEQLEEINRYKFQLEEENHYLQQQIKTTATNAEIIGSGGGLKIVFYLIASVASSDSTVLIQGETGTGKELIAAAIHDGSPRKEKLMVKVNCAALPAQLIESELFGHEKGSFTGAIERRIGKFELANNGTIFLDEIGELALELQVKLLRVIQEKEIERIGGKGIIKTDVRIIVATNRDLKKEVDAGRFRSDLFYRLNVFPIILPPLRERKEDIPAFVAHFVDRLSAKSGKKIMHVSPKAIADLVLYDWPGNIRELEHVIERSILMTNGTTIREIYLTKTEKRTLSPLHELPLKSMEENERDHIVAALKKTNGRIRGAGGAAELLQVPPTTLHSKMKKLGIRKKIN